MLIDRVTKNVFVGEDHEVWTTGVSRRSDLLKLCNVLD